MNFEFLPNMATVYAMAVTFAVAFVALFLIGLWHVNKACAKAERPIPMPGPSAQAKFQAKAVILGEHGFEPYDKYAAPTIKKATTTGTVKIANPRCDPKSNQARMAKWFAENGVKS